MFVMIIHEGHENEERRFILSYSGLQHLVEGLLGFFCAFYFCFVVLYTRPCALSRQI